MIGVLLLMRHAGYALKGAAGRAGMATNTDSQDNLLESLRQIGAEAYAEVFIRERIGVDILRTLTDSDLRELGIPLGDRKRILTRLAEYQLPGEPASIQANRRVLTILFIDLVGSTSFSEVMDLEDYRALLVEYQHAVGAVVREEGGFLARAIGDGLLCYFGYPRTQEVDALNAANAALRMPAAVRDLAVPGGAVAQTRCGVATGPTIVDDEASLLPLERNQSFGEAPNLAARLQGLAPPNGTVICERTRRLIAGHFSCQSLEAVKLKGFSRAERPSLLVERLIAPTRFNARAMAGLTPYINRESELRMLARNWAQSQNFIGRAVVLRGEPGIGKSHFVYEFLRRNDVPERSQVHLQCDAANSGRPLHPLVSLLAAIVDGVGEDVFVRRLERLLMIGGSQSGNLRDVLRFLMSPADGDEKIDPDHAVELRKDSFRLVLNLLDGLQRIQPTVIVLEDAHWIDPSSEALLSEIVERISRWRVLLIVTCRNEYRLPKGMAGVVDLTLNALTESDSTDLVEQLLEGRQLSPDLLKQLLRRNEGVPLFLEELTRAILEHPGMTERDGVLDLDASEESAQELPTTLAGSLLARLDRRPGTRSIVAAASAIGREFPVALLAEVLGEDAAQLDHTLGGLVEARILHRLPDGRSFRFHHALIQDAAYQTLLKSARREIHNRIAIALSKPVDSIMVPAAANAPHIVARHFQQAGDGERAHPFWLRAIREAQSRSAHFEAISFCQMALASLEHMQEQTEAFRAEIDVRELLYLSQEATAWGSDDIKGNLNTINNLREKMGKQPESIAVLHGNAGTHLLIGELEKSAAIAQELADLETSMGPATAVLGHKLLGICRLYQARYAEATQHFETSLEAIVRDVEGSTQKYYHADARLVCEVFKAWAHALSGDVETAQMLLPSVVATAATQLDEMSRVYGYCVVSCVCQTVGDARSALDFSERAFRIADQKNSNYWMAWAQIVRGWSKARLGQTERGVLEIEEGISAYADTGTRQFLPYARLLLVEAYFLNSRLDDAETLAAALEDGGEMGEMICVKAPLAALRQSMTAAR